MRPIVTDGKSPKEMGSLKRHIPAHHAVDMLNFIGRWQHCGNSCYLQFPGTLAFVLYLKECKKDCVLISFVVTTTSIQAHADRQVP